MHTNVCTETLRRTTLRLRKDTHVKWLVVNGVNRIEIRNWNSYVFAVKMANQTLACVTDVFLILSAHTISRRVGVFCFCRNSVDAALCRYTLYFPIYLSFIFLIY